MTGVAAASPWTGRRWWLAVAAVAFLGLAVRVGYVLVVLADVPPGLDAIWYQLQGGSIRNGTGYVVPRSWLTGVLIPTPAFPPAYPGYQALWQWLVGDGPTAVRLAGLVPAAATIVLTALLGRRLAGPRVGLAAAVVVAVHPGLIAGDGSAMSENLTVPLVVGAQLLALTIVDRARYRERPDVAGDRRKRSTRVLAQSGMALLGLGVVLGAAVLTRQDLALFAVVLVGWTATLTAGRDWRTALAVGAVVALGLATIVTPWMLRNLRAVDVAAVSTLSPTSALAGANCPLTYQRGDLGSWRYDCVIDARPGAMSEEDLLANQVGEAELMDAYQAAAQDHVSANLDRLPAVLAARQARAWGWWDPRDLADRDTDESRRYGWQLVANPVSAVLAVAGGGALVALHRRRRDHRHLVLATAVVAVAVSVTLGYGNPRFALTAQPALVLAALLAARRSVLVRRLGARPVGRRSAPGQDPTSGTVTA
jgi:4-amino-4-deoxy-L-arabinose transferase-like glycosyltransferase